MERDLLILSIVVALIMCVLGAGFQHPIAVHSTITHPSIQQPKYITVPRSTRDRVINPVKIEKQDMYAASLHSLPKAHCLYQSNALEHGPHQDRLQLTDSLPGVRVSAAEQPESVAYAPPEIITNDVDHIVSNIKSGIGQPAFQHQNEFPASVPYVYPGTLLYQCKPAKPKSPKPVHYQRAAYEQTHVPLPVAQRCGTGQPVPEDYRESPASVSYSSPILTAYNIDPTTASGGNTLLKHTTWTGNQTASSQQYHVNPALASSGTGYGAPAYEGVNEFPADVHFKTQRTQSYEAKPSLASQGSPGLATPANERQNEFPARVNFKTNRITAYQAPPQRGSQRLAGMVSPANEHRNEFPASLGSVVS